MSLKLESKYNHRGYTTGDTDYYGRPLYRNILMRFDFKQSGQIMEPRWNDKYPGRRPLGIAPSGKFAIYQIRQVPTSIRSRFELTRDLWPHIPPTDQFVLWYAWRYQWRREEFKIPLLLPERALVEIEVKSHATNHR